MSKDDFLKIIETLDIVTIKYLDIRYESYKTNNEAKELIFDNN